MIAAEVMLLSFVAGALCGGVVVWYALRDQGAKMYVIGRLDQVRDRGMRRLNAPTERELIDLR